VITPTKWESKNEITGITQPSRLFYMIQHRQFQVGCLFGLTPEQTDKQNKQVGYYYCNTGGYELFGSYQSLAIKFAHAEISAKTDRNQNMVISHR